MWVACCPQVLIAGGGLAAVASAVMTVLYHTATRPHTNGTSAAAVQPAEQRDVPWFKSVMVGLYVSLFHTWVSHLGLWPTLDPFLATPVIKVILPMAGLAAYAVIIYIIAPLWDF
jgi:hypothetical protein